MSLAEYRSKRDFGRTPEPSRRGRRGKILRFVVQKHAASRLHYDFRLETEGGMLKSWAVPKGISLDPEEKRLAVETEDHPLSYASFEGEIPAGNYGAGSVIIWDTGEYRSDRDIRQQLAEGKVKFELYGQKLRGSFSLVRMRGNMRQWLLIKARDRHASSKDVNALMPDSVLSGKGGQKRGESLTAKNRAGLDFPSAIRPMLALPAGEPFDRKDWVFEVKWDGVRAVLFRNKRSGVLSLQSRNGNDITSRYPELVRMVDPAVHCTRSAVLDGEIVVLDEKGRPDFQRHQRRMNVSSVREIAALSKSSSATYYVFDIIYLDGRSLEQLDFVDRREILERVVRDPSGTIRISEYIEEKGRATFDGATRLGLEGIVAKYKFSKYLQGARSSWWLKVKRVLTQDCAVIGYTRGEGNRKGYFGSLILAAMVGGKLRFVGHTGSGFGYDQLAEALELMQPLRVDDCPIDGIPYVNRPAAWLRSKLVAEVKLNGWTADMIMRAPIFVRFRDDKEPQECIIESHPQSARKDPAGAPASSLTPKFSNLGKVFWPATSGRRALAKQDLIDYYSSISDYILPYLRNRPLSLSRYPDGIAGKSFFHKNWEADAPDFVKTVPVYSESRGEAINYIVCNNRETLLWLANLGCIEMHPWYSQVHDFDACSRQAAGKPHPVADIRDKCGLSTPDFIVFDLDPYIYSGKEAGAEPEYSERGFAAAVEVGLALHDLLEGMRIKSYAKTSGRTGLHVVVPVAPIYSYEQTREFARLVGKILQNKSPSQITMQWSTSERTGKVFFDYNQNARGKTVASIFSARPTTFATVSMPVSWDRLTEIRPLDFTITNAPAILQESGHPWAGVLDNRQDIGELLSKANGSYRAAEGRPGHG